MQPLAPTLKRFTTKIYENNLFSGWRHGSSGACSPVTFWG
ncbi:hypothetical protein CKA32_005891 [Geitlerinema sp. FC II]|nr:hypothetical protein CKA32_005891 [Geitlerinema sp. FC II]